MKYFLLGFFIGIAVALVHNAISETRYTVNVIDFNTNNESIDLAVRSGIRLLRRELPQRFRVGKVAKKIDKSPGYLQLEKRADWLEAHYSKKKRNTITLALFQRRYKNDYGLSRVCPDRKFAVAGIDSATPGERIKLFTAHEIGHVLGSWHREPLFWQEETDPKLHVMCPYWDVFFEALELGRAEWSMHKLTKKQIRKCGDRRFSFKSYWVM